MDWDELRMSSIVAGERGECSPTLWRADKKTE